MNALVETLISLGHSILKPDTMNLNYLLFLLFPICSFGQNLRITYLESDSVLLHSKWYTLLKEDVEGLANWARDSILDLESKKHTARYEELMKAYERYSCTGYDSKREKEMVEEMEDRQVHLKSFAESAEALLLSYEDSLLVLWKEELLIVVDSLALDWNYDFVLKKEALAFLPIETARVQILFEEAVVKGLNQRIDKNKWEIKRAELQKKCTESIQKGMYVIPVNVQKELSKLDVFRKVALWMHGAKLT
jgi:hypothetical protein